MSDIVERPDNAPASYDAVVEAYEHMREMCREAQDGWSEERRKLWQSIDEITRLRGEVERLREALGRGEYAIHQWKRAFEGGRVRDLDEAQEAWEIAYRRTIKCIG